MTRRRRLYLLLLLPGVLYLLVFFVYPMAGMLWRSVSSPSGMTLHFYGRLLREPVYFKVFVTSFEIALEVTLLTLVLAYPLAYFLARLQPRVTNVLLVMVVLPFFTSTLVRTYAWMVLLGSEGLVNQALVGLRVPGAPVRLLYNRTGMLIGMSYILLPYMILTLYSVMRGIDRGLLQAAASVGAGPLRAFWRVVLRLPAHLHPRPRLLHHARVDGRGAGHHDRGDHRATRGAATGLALRVGAVHRASRRHCRRLRRLRSRRGHGAPLRGEAVAVRRRL